MISFGSEYKYSVSIPPIGGTPLSALDFEVTTYVYTNKAVTYKKSDTEHVKKLNNDTYIIVIDTENALKVGRGNVLAKLTIHIPDGDFKDGYRTEIYDGLDTGWKIV